MPDRHDGRRARRLGRRHRIGKEYGFRNGQATVLAPTGTIGFMMDCDTTGIEPDIALIKYKRLVGGGMIKIVNNTIDRGAGQARLRRRPGARRSSSTSTREETIEGAPGLKDEHLPVFDCAFRAANGTRSIHYHGSHPHDGGGAAVPLGRDLEDGQPADRRAPSRTSRTRTSSRGSWASRRSRSTATAASAPSRCRPARPIPGWRKSRRACRRRRPATPRAGRRRRCARKLPDERQSLTHKFSIAGHEGYIHVGLYETGEPGEIFVRMAKEGSTISGLMDSFATAISLALQHGVPLRLLCDKFSRTRFEPSGFTGNPEIPRATLDHGLPVPVAGRRSSCKQDAPVTRGRAVDPPPPRRSQRVGEVVAPPRAEGRGRSTSSTPTAKRPTATQRPQERRQHATPATATTASSPAPTRRPAPNADRS